MSARYVCWTCRHVDSGRHDYDLFAAQPICPAGHKLAWVYDAEHLVGSRDDHRRWKLARAKADKEARKSRRRRVRRRARM